MSETRIYCDDEGRISLWRAVTWFGHAGYVVEDSDGVWINDWKHGPEDYNLEYVGTL